MTGGEVAMLVEAGDPARLASLIELQALMRTAQGQVSAATEMLAEASTADLPERLPVLAFQLDLALRDLEATTAGLDPRLRPLLLEQVAALRTLAEGPKGVVEARRQELALIAEGTELLDEIGGLSAELTAAVDGLGSAARRDIGAAIGDALDVQRLSTRALIVVVALSLLTSALIVWLYVGRNIVRRLTALSDGMLAIAGGRLHAPVAVGGGDEIAAMGRAVEVFRRNTLERDGLLAEKAQAAERLEKEVEQRTAELSEALHEVGKKSQQLEDANMYKSRFLASASHDLRQPLHALNLLAAQLRADADPEERVRLVAHINAAVGAMNELFDALLDMSKLDAGVLEADVTEFPVGPLLARMETTFGEAARAKGLRLRVVPSGAWVRSDFILLERILLNLVSNAVRHTPRGVVLIGCRRRGGRLRVDVCDSGTGIAEEERERIFGEFVQLAPGPGGGLGLGLSIVDRLGRLLGHPVEMDSRLGRGSRFSVTVPLVAARSEAAGLPPALAAVADPARGKLVVVIDDDALALDGMGGILRSWGCDVVTANSPEAALAALAARRHVPDLFIADYRLAGAETGIAAIVRLRAARWCRDPGLPRKRRHRARAAARGARGRLPSDAQAGGADAAAGHGKPASEGARRAGRVPGAWRGRAPCPSPATGRPAPEVRAPQGVGRPATDASCPGASVSDEPPSGEDMAGQFRLPHAETGQLVDIVKRQDVLLAEVRILEGADGEDHREHGFLLLPKAMRFLPASLIPTAPQRMQLVRRRIVIASRPNSSARFLPKSSNQRACAR